MNTTICFLATHQPFRTLHKRLAEHHWHPHRKGCHYSSATRRISTPTRLRANSCWPCSLPSLSWSVSISNSDSVRASRSLRRRESTWGGSLPKSTGRGSVSFMGNGSPRVSQGVTLCGEWACRLTLSIAVSGSMNRSTALPSQPLLDSSLIRTETPPELSEGAHWLFAWQRSE